MVALLLLLLLFRVINIIITNGFSAKLNVNS